MYMSPELDHQPLPVQRALRIRERMQQDKVLNAHQVEPAGTSSLVERVSLYWNKVDLSVDDDEEPHVCAARP